LRLVRSSRLAGPPQWPESMDHAAVVGIGRIGLCLALNLERAGYAVLGIDRDRDLVARIRGRTYQSVEPGVERALAGAGHFVATGDFQDVKSHGPGTILVAVDTPTCADGYDTSHVDRVLQSLAALGPVTNPTDLVIVCTTSPGYCDEAAGVAARAGYTLSYSPGFVAQGSVMRDQQHPDQVLIGEADAAAGARLETLFRRVCVNQPPVFRMSRLSAEIAKLATNAFVTMKIAFANAIGDLALRTGAQPAPILEALAADRRIGAEALSYGFGFGGPCFPRDNRALRAFARRSGLELLQAEATEAMNRRHLDFQLAEYLRRPEQEAIHFDGVTYKAGTDLLDESQPLALALALAHAGRRVVIHESPGVIGVLRERFVDLFEYAPPRS
jgi:UDPglucose 6-dehydrogenase